MEDKQILALFLARSGEAIEELQRRDGPQCLALARRFLPDERDAQECVNDALLALWHAIPPAQPIPLRPYLYKVVRNQCLKRLEHQAASKRSAYMVAMQELEPYCPAPDCVEDDFSARESYRTLTQHMEAFLSTLSKENRIIFLRRYWFCDSYADIARRVGLREKTVSVRLTRLRKKLRLFLLKKEENE